MKNIKHEFAKIKAVLLLAVFLFTFALNSLHFVIFSHDHHHHNCNKIEHNDFSFNESESHSNCLWEFAKSDSNKQSITLNSLAYIYIDFPTKKYFINFTKAVRYYSLRAPPY